MQMLFSRALIVGQRDIEWEYIFERFGTHVW